MKFSGMLKDDALKGKVILITGGGTGLGKSMGAYFMELGANLIITSRKQEVLNKTAEELPHHDLIILDGGCEKQLPGPEFSLLGDQAHRQQC